MLGIVVFLLAADQFLFTGMLSRPLAACTLIGAACGNLQAGLMAGGAIEMLLAGADESIRILDRRNYVFASAAAVILTASAGLDAQAAAGFAPVLIAAGTGLNHLLSIVNISLLPSARNAAETRNEKKLAVTHFLPLLIAAAVSAVIAVLMQNAVSANAENIVLMAEKYEWVYKALCMAGSLMPCVGFAVLLRNLSVKDMKGAFWAGAAAGSMITAAISPAAALVICAGAAFGAAAYDYHQAVKDETPVKTQKGGGQKWW